MTEAVDTLDDLLTRERRSHQKVWTERERLYQSVNDTVIEIDTRFKCILESKSKSGSVQGLHKASA